MSNSVCLRPYLVSKLYNNLIKNHNFLHIATQFGINFGMAIREYTFKELCEKQVINVAEGRNLGHIFDITFTCTGQVCGLVVILRKSFWRTISAATDSLFIPWRNIIKIGTDVILVEMVTGCGILGVEDTGEVENLSVE